MENDKLLFLKVYKSLGDISSAQKMFDHYTTVSNENANSPWLKWRDIVISRRKPRKMWIQANTVKKGANCFHSNIVLLLKHKTAGVSDLSGVVVVIPGFYSAGWGLIPSREIIKFLSLR
jgi:hypothetical protein